MRKNLGGGSKVIKARLAAYAEAVKAGASSQEAYEAARKITLRSLKEQAAPAEATEAERAKNYLDWARDTLRFTTPIQ